MTNDSQNRIDDYIRDAQMHHLAGRLEAARAAYQAALDLNPTHPGLLNNLATIFAQQAHHQEAVDLFKSSIKIAPTVPSTHYNIGLSYHQLGANRQAIDAFRRVTQLEPGHYDAHRRLGFLYLAGHNREAALDHFARTYELRRGEDHAWHANRSLTHATAGKLCHDAEQFAYLATKLRDGGRFDHLARCYHQAATRFSEVARELDDNDRAHLGDDYNTPIHIFSAAEIAGPVINPDLDSKGVEQVFALDKSPAMHLDDVLTQAALARLQRFLLESTIWHDFDHIGGFVASYLEDGLACPLVLQIADELRQVLPHVLADRPLSQAWAFKALAPAASVDLHADDGTVSLNLWLTPDAANRNRNTGGLIICRTPPPAHWTITGYGEDHQEIAAFVEENSDNLQKIDYRQNRAALFASRLFHGSDRPNFAAGYENHRINLTLIYNQPTI